MKLHNEDCIEQMQKMIDEGVQVDSIVTDPPYELNFMGKSWDSTGIAFQKNTWELAFQLLKPGGHLLAFGGSRTYHRMAVAIEDAGFEIRDQIMWLYGSGFPKSLNIGKAIDKKAGAKRKVVGQNQHPTSKDRTGNKSPYQAEDSHLDASFDITKGNSEWEGWGTALKPAHEPIVMARKPIEGTVADNVLKHGTGGINIDESRVALEGESPPSGSAKRVYRSNQYTEEKTYGDNKTTPESGRFPANVIHDGSEEVMEGFPETKSGMMKQHIEGGQYNVYGKMYPRDVETIGDEGSAARFFYCAKTSRKERNTGISKNNHPTVKPVELMKYLCKLVTPKGGTIFDPFMGSGSTGMAAKEEGYEFMGIEKEEDYYNIAMHRINNQSPLKEFM